MIGHISEDHFSLCLHQAKVAHEEEIASLMRDLAVARAQLVSQHITQAQQLPQLDAGADNRQVSDSGLAGGHDAISNNRNAGALAERNYFAESGLSDKSRGSSPTQVGVKGEGGLELVAKETTGEPVSPSHSTKSLTSKGSKKHHFLKETRHDNWFARFVTGTPFHLAVASCIFLNTVGVAIEAQYRGQLLGSSYGYMHIDSHSLAWPGLEDAFYYSDWCFGTLFSIELVLNIVGLRCDYFKHASGWFDTVVIALWWIGFSYVASLGRIARMLRIHHILKLFKQMSGIDPLFMLTTAISGCWAALFWALFIIVVVEVIVSLALNLLLSEFYFSNESYPYHERQEVYVYFGTSTRALFSMFELTFGNYPPISRMLVENVSEWFMFATLMHKVTMGFAILGVINGVFIQETFKAAALDDRMMVRQKFRALNAHRTKMTFLFEAADSDSSGALDRAEFHKVMTQNPDIKTWLASMDIDVSDVDRLYDLIDDGDQAVSVNELIQGVGHLRGPARCVDMVYLLREVACLRKEVAAWSSKRDVHGQHATALL